MKFNKEVDIKVIIDKLRVAVEVLRFEKGTPYCQSNLLVTGVLGMVGLGAAGVFMSLRKNQTEKGLLSWTLERRDSSNVSLPVGGLQNLGNNCFLNVVLQTLASCSCFYPYLQDMLNNNDLDLDGRAEKMPLTCALASLLNDLCVPQKENIILSPKKVMIAMGLYIGSFNLTRQQDAAEAFLHLLTSLQEEFSDNHVSDYSLADVITISGDLESSEAKRHNSFRKLQEIIGPFDGTVGSMLVCCSCSSQLSIDYDVFRCLPLPPVLDGNANIMDGCTLADCLNHFTAAEYLQNYTCGRCWHINAMKYLSLNKEENETRIRTINQCFKHDSCECKTLFVHEVFQPSGSSNAFKQLCIAHCPKILCLHLQRASMNMYGDFIKLKGHVSFPLVLDLFPFTAATKKLGFNAMEEGHWQQLLRYSQRPCHYNMQLKMQTVPRINRFTVLDSKVVAFNDSNFSSSFSSEDSKCDKRTSENWNSTPWRRSCKYDLVSVVEHYGRPGSGHYAVYRRLRSSLNADGSLVQNDDHDQTWVYISDSEVSRVSLEAVLSAEASLLIYQKTDADS